MLKKASPVKEILKRSPCINFFNAYVRIVRTSSTKMKIFSVLDLKYKNLETTHKERSLLILVVPRFINFLTIKKKINKQTIKKQKQNKTKQNSILRLYIKKY